MGTRRCERNVNSGPTLWLREDARLYTTLDCAVELRIKLGSCLDTFVVVLDIFLERSAAVYIES